ncbi:hypothetical protein R6Q59_010037 [Mikania micrantha]
MPLIHRSLMLRRMLVRKSSHWTSLCDDLVALDGTDIAVLVAGGDYDGAGAAGARVEVADGVVAGGGGREGDGATGLADVGAALGIGAGVSEDVVIAGVFVRDRESPALVSLGQGRGGAESSEGESDDDGGLHFEYWK